MNLEQQNPEKALYPTSPSLRIRTAPTIQNISPPRGSDCPCLKSPAPSRERNGRETIIVSGPGAGHQNCFPTLPGNNLGVQRPSRETIWGSSARGARPQNCFRAPGRPTPKLFPERLPHVNDPAAVPKIVSATRLFRPLPNGRGGGRDKQRGGESSTFHACIFHPLESNVSGCSVMPFF